MIVGRTLLYSIVFYLLQVGYTSGQPDILLLFCLGCSCSRPVQVELMPFVHCSPYFPVPEPTQSMCLITGFP